MEWRFNAKVPFEKIIIVLYLFVYKIKTFQIIFMSGLSTKGKELIKLKELYV
jgi:hypothetical protein